MSDNNSSEPFSVKPQSIPKTPTNVKGLDEVLQGGLPTGRLTIINGGPGAGKTVLALELLIRGTESNRPAVFVSFEESGKAIRRNALSLGWDLEQIEEEGRVALLNPEVKYDAVASGEFSISGLCAILDGLVRETGAEVIVIDALDKLMRLFNDSTQARNQMETLHSWLSERELTVVMTVKEWGDRPREYDYLDFMADCVININQHVQDEVTTRRLKVKKYRGSDFASREHPFTISDRGIVVMSLSALEMVPRPSESFISSGIEALDVILGGGYRRGSAVLINGPSGGGKTTLAFTLTEAAEQRDERVLYFSLEESQQTLIREMKSVGLNLKASLDSGNLRIISVMPESKTLEAHLYNIIEEINEYKPDYLVIDAISATMRMGSKKAANEFMIRLFYAARSRGITCVYTNQTLSQVSADLEFDALGLSSLVDTTIVLNYVREKDHIERSLLVLKSRGVNHSHMYHKFKITENGFLIDNPANK